MSDKRVSGFTVFAVVLYTAGVSAVAFALGSAVMNHRWQTHTLDMMINWVCEPAKDNNGTGDR